MANNETNWTINLADKVTGPMRNVIEVIQKAETAVVQLNESFTEASEQVMSMLSDERTARRQVLTLISAQTLALRTLNAEGGAGAWTATENSINSVLNRIPDYEAAINSARSASPMNRDEMLSNAKDFTDIASQVGGAFDFSNEISAVSVNIQRMTGTSGEELQSLTNSANTLSKVYGADMQDIASSANAMAKQMNIPYAEAFNLMDLGFQKGGNLNGDMLDQIKEFGPEWKKAGISASEGIALMANAGKAGISSEAALDVVKTAGDSLNNRSESQEAALKGIGLSGKDLDGKTSLEATQEIAAAMQGASDEAQQAVMSNIFKDAGATAGLGFVMGFSDVNMDLSSIESVEQAGSGMNTVLSGMQNVIMDTFGSAIPVIQNFGTVAGGLGSVIQLMQGVSKATWLWNGALLANPIIWIVIGIAALIAGIALAWDKFEGFRAVILGLWEVFKTVFSNIGNLFKAIVGPIIEGIAALWDQDFEKLGTILSNYNPLEKINEFMSGGALAGVDKAWEKGAKDAKRPEDKLENKPKATAGAMKIGSPEDNKLAVKAPVSNSVGVNSSAGIGAGAASSGNKSFVMNLEIKNYFNNLSSKLDVRKVADEVAGVINDRLKDAVVNF